MWVEACNHVVHDNVYVGVYSNDLRIMCIDYSIGISLFYKSVKHISKVYYFYLLLILTKMVMRIIENLIMIIFINLSY